MFYDLEMTEQKRTIRFSWQYESGECVVIRNMLTKHEYFQRLCNDSLSRNGINLWLYTEIPKGVPLEAVSRQKGRTDRSCGLIRNCDPYVISYYFQRQRDRTVTMVMQAPEIPEIQENLKKYIPANLIYFIIYRLDGEKIPLYLPELHSGRNEFCFTDPGRGYRRAEKPVLNENALIDGKETVKGVFRLKESEL